MKKVFHKTAALLMTFVVLISTLSFTINMHYCGDNLVDTAILHKAKGCGMEIQNTSSKDCSITKKNCCSNKQITVKGQDELQLSFQNFALDQQIFVATFCYFYINLFEGLEENTRSFSEYPPPLLVKDIHKLDETYLI